MSVKFTLKSNRSQYELILNDSGADLFKNSHHIVNKFINDSQLPIEYIAVNYHDKDVDDEIQQLKTPHYHVVISMEKSCMAKNMIKYVSDLFHCNENQIQIDECIDLSKKTRYLCHLDNFDKEKYSINNIVSNDYKLMHKYLETIKIKDVDDIINLVHQYKTIEKLIHVMGKKKYREYRGIIIDLRKEIYHL